MTIDFNESALISIYRKKSRRQTIDNIKEMMTHLESDETSLKNLSESVVKKLKEMTDDEFEAMDISPVIDILE